MSSPNANERILAAIPELTPDVLRFAREHFRTGDIKKVINALAGFTVEELRTSLETCKPDDLKDLQGQIKGVKTFLGKINEQANQ